MKALIISADNFEDSELLVPYYRLKEAGVEVVMASPSRGATKGKHGYEVAVDMTLAEVNPDDYAILVLPRGAALALVRKEPKALEIARSFFCPQQTGCGHLPWPADPDQRRPYAGATRHVLQIGG